MSNEPEESDVGLEVLVNESAKGILNNPRKCQSALLEVTVIKPKEVECIGGKIRNILRVGQLKQMIDQLEKKFREKRKIIENLKADNTIIEVRRFKSEAYPINNKQQNTFDKKKPEKKLHFEGIGDMDNKIFCKIRKSSKNINTKILDMKNLNYIISQTTTNESTSNEFIFLKRNNSDIKSLLNNNNNNNNNGFEKKCICENCGVIGLLSQTNDKKYETIKTERQKSIIINLEKNFNNHFTDQNNQTTYYSTIEKNIKTGCKQHQYKSNPNCYECQDAYNVHLHNLIKKVQALEERLTFQEKKAVSRDYFKHIISKITTEVTGTKTPEFDDKLYCFRCESSYRCNKATATSAEYSNGFWKWGEEILRPGIDLKNKIIHLLNDVLNKFHRSRPQCDVEWKDNWSNQEGSRTYQTNYVVNTQEKTEHIFNMEKIHKNYPENNKQNSDKCTKVDVSYINPKLITWAEKHQFEDMRQLEREHFARMIIKFRPSQKEMLWKNIWNLAQANGQTKLDNITIKIPKLSDKSDLSEMHEIELTIGETEKMLTSPNPFL